MLNPITGKRIFLFAYIIIWVIIAIIQMIMFIMFFEIDLLPALIDSLLVNLLHALIGLAIWYPVRFNPVSSKNLINPLFAILITGVLTVTLWVSISFFILKSLFPGDEYYIGFLNRSVTNRIIIDFLLYVVLVLVYSLIVYSSNLKEKISDEANLRTLVREAELNMLKAQINPHFLFNALNSISLLTKKDPGGARNMIIKLSDYLRYSLRFGQESMISFGEEIENMERYLDIEKIRFGKKLKYRKSIGVETDQIRLPNMILQPLLENAIKHGVYESLVPVTVDISANLKGEMLIVTVENEFDPDATPRKGAGIGLKNINSRLELIYSRTDLLKYQQKDRYFRVELRIPQSVKTENKEL